MLIANDQEFTYCQVVASQVLTILGDCLAWGLSYARTVPGLYQQSDTPRLRCILEASVPYLPLLS